MFEITGIKRYSCYSMQRIAGRYIRSIARSDCSNFCVSFAVYRLAIRYIISNHKAFGPESQSKVSNKPTFKIQQFPEKYLQIMKYCRQNYQDVGRKHFCIKGTPFMIYADESEYIVKSPMKFDVHRGFLSWHFYSNFLMRPTSGITIRPAITTCITFPGMDPNG